MQKKTKIRVQGKEIVFSEVTVGEYWTLLKDFEQFCEEYFQKYKVNRNKFTSEQMGKILEHITLVEEENPLMELVNTENTNSKKYFHRVIGRFMYIMKLGYHDVINMPLSVFFSLSKDLEYIIGEKEDKEEMKTQNFSGKPEKEKLKRLFSNQ